MLAMEDSSLAHEILSWAADIEIEFALAQIEAGADMIGTGDAAASIISPAMYQEFALPYEKLVIDAIHNAGSYVKLHICGNTQKHLPYMAEGTRYMLSAGCEIPRDTSFEVFSAFCNAPRSYIAE